MKTITSIAAILALGSQAAFAGTLAPPMVEDEVIVVEDTGMAGGLLGPAIVGGLLGLAALAAIINDDDDEPATTTE